VPTAKPANEKPASRPATTQAVRPPSSITIDQNPVEFPPAILRIRQVDDQLHAILSSDDPREALDRDYKGNSFYLELPGTLAEVSDVTDKPYAFLSDSKEREDSTDGIFLEGNHYHLQPQNVKVEIKGGFPKLEAYISGTFLMFSMTDDTVPGKLVPVAGRLELEVRQ
jgi:hypothetical protein